MVAVAEEEAAEAAEVGEEVEVVLTPEGEAEEEVGAFIELVLVAERLACRCLECRVSASKGQRDVYYISYVL